jgi:hypothetical protein
VTYWLYFAHFFFLTTLAVRTDKTSIWALYLWGVLFGLYESWITKVIWYGYGGDGIFAIGNIGPYGYSEISMVFFFHPIMSFIFPLAVSCIIYPQLRKTFPDLAWFTGKSKGARIIQAYLVFSFATIIGMNSGGPTNLVLNLFVVLILILLLSRLARLNDSCINYHVVVFSRRGFFGLCLYLALLYGVAYIYLRPEGLPSFPVQLLTFVLYALVVAGLWLHDERKPLPSSIVEVEQRELKLVKLLFVSVLVLGFIFSIFARAQLFTLVIVSFLIWTPLGFLLTIIAMFKGIRERINGAQNSYTCMHLEKKEG